MKNDNWSRFTKQAKDVMGRSSDYAWKYPKENLIDSDHLCLAMLDQADDDATQIMLSAGIDFESVKSELLNSLPKPVEVTEELKKQNQLVLSPEYKLILENAVASASVQSLQYIGTKHLLMGMLMLDDSVTQQILVKNGVELATVRRANSLPTKEQSVAKKNNRANLIYIFIFIVVIIEILVERYLLN